MFKIFHWQFHLNLPPQHLKPTHRSLYMIYKEGKARDQTDTLFVYAFLCPQSASNRALFCVNKRARLVNWAGSKYLGRRWRRGHWVGWVLRGRAEDEEKEEEDYANVSKQLWSNPESEKNQDKKKDRHTNRVKEEIQPHSEK